MIPCGPQTQYGSEDGLELQILLPPECGSCRCMPFYVILGIKSRASCLLGNHSAS